MFDGEYGREHSLYGVASRLEPLPVGAHLFPRPFAVFLLENHVHFDQLLISELDALAFLFGLVVGAVEPRLLRRAAVGLVARQHAVLVVFVPSLVGALDVELDLQLLAVNFIVINS